MDLTVERDGGVVFFCARDRVDSDNSAEFRDRVLDAVAEGDRMLVIDLSQVSYVSSAGLQSFLVLARHMKQSGLDFGLCSMSDGVSYVFEVAGFDRVLRVFDDRAAACASLGVAAT